MSRMSDRFVYLVLFVLACLFAVVLAIHTYGFEGRY